MLTRMCGNCIFWSQNHKEHERCKSCSPGRNNFVPRDMECPVPSCKSRMIYYRNDTYLACPDCGTEIWPFVMEKSDKSVIRQEFEKGLPCERSHYESAAIMHVSSKKASGSKSKSRNKKQVEGKKTTTQLYKELVGACGIVENGNRLDAVLKDKA